ncbi:MAG: hypothetical protein LCH88_00725 [Proteobacteria bacterium]|nr:hypothetical protein [Pseudomonadota bacterium]
MTATPSGSATSTGSRPPEAQEPARAAEAKPSGAAPADLPPEDRAKLDELAAALDGFSLQRAAADDETEAIVDGFTLQHPAETEPAPSPPVPAQHAPVSANAENAPMIPWIETKQFTVDLFPSWAKTEGDKEWSLGAVTVDVGDISRRFDQVIAELNQDQWEIKMVVPLDKSLTYHEHQKVVRQGNRREAEAVLGAFGLGWAAGTTASLLLVCQRTEWLDQADYKARIKVRNDKLAGEQRARDRETSLEHNKGINAKITAAQKVLDDLRTNGVTVKKSGFLRGEKFVVDTAEFSNRTEAESALRARIGELEADLAALPRQLRPLD